MNTLDAILIIIIVLFAIRGIFRGLITELIVLISLTAGFMLAFSYAGTGIKILQKYFPLLPEFAAKIIAFIIIFLVINIVLRLIGKMLNRFAKFAYLQSINRLAGGLFALTKVSMIISVVFVLIEILPFAPVILKAINAHQSFLYPYLRDFAPMVYQSIAAVIPGAGAHYDQLWKTMQQVDSTAKHLVKPF